MPVQLAILSDAPSASRRDGTLQLHGGDHAIRPLPESSISLAVLIEELLRDGFGGADLLAQPHRAFAVPDREHNLLELISDLPMGFFGAARRYRAALYGKRQIDIASRIRREHFWILGQPCRDAELFLLEIDVSDRVARRRFDQMPQPPCRPEDKI